MYKLTTNDGDFIVSKKPTIQDALIYMKIKMDSGYSRHEIVFSYSRIRTYQNSDQIISHILNKSEKVVSR